MNKTQTATITRSYQIGPQQMLHTVPAGATVRVWVGDGTSELYLDRSQPLHRRRPPQRPPVRRMSTTVRRSEFSDVTAGQIRFWIFRDGEEADPGRRQEVQPQVRRPLHQLAWPVLLLRVRRPQPRQGALLVMKTTKDKTARYVIVNEGSGRIVATTAGTHSILERLCARLMERKSGTYFYDDATNAGAYLPQVGPNVGLSVGRRVRMEIW